MRIAAATAVAAIAAATVVGTATTASADGAWGSAIGSPGFLSSNLLQFPVDIDTNFCGNSFALIGILDGPVGNTCINR